LKLYFVRHGENQANIDKVLSHKIVDYSLTPKGVKQSQYLAEWLADHDIARIYSSPLKRAYETAQIVANRLNLTEIRLIEDLRELNVGVLDGKGDPDSWVLHDAILKSWWEGDPESTFEGGENHHGLRQRLRFSTEQIVRESLDLQTGNVVVLGHGALFTFGLPILCADVPWEKVNVGLRNTAVTVVEVSENSYNCLHWGLTDHLPPA
jgi:probable phosphoglycerate mutase